MIGSIIRLSLLLPLVIGLVIPVPLACGGLLYGQDSASPFLTDNGRSIRMPVPVSSARIRQATLADTIAWYLQATLRESERDDILVALYTSADDRHLSRAVRPGEPLTRAQTALYNEALLVADVTLFQERTGKAEPVYFDTGPESKRSPRSKSFRPFFTTEIYVHIHYLDLADGQFLGGSTITAADSNASALKSEAGAFDQLNRQLRLEMARVYGPSGDVERSGPDFLLKGHYAKDFPNRQIFALVAPASNHSSDLAGFAIATTSHEEETVLQVSRLWRDLSPGSWAMPYTQPVFSLYLHLQPPLFGSYSQYGLYLQGNPLARTDWGFGLNIIRAKDSFDDLDYGVGLSAFGRYRVKDGTRFDAGVKLGADLDIPFRRDDADNSVSTLLFSSQAAVTADVLLTPSTDLLWSVGYRISNRANSWDYSEEEESYPAQWQGAAPSISSSGFFITVGFRYSLLEFAF